MEEFENLKALERDPWYRASEFVSGAESQLDIILTRAQFAELLHRTPLFQTLVDLKQRKHVQIRLLCPYSEKIKLVIRELAPFLFYRSFAASSPPGLSILIKDQREIFVVDETSDLKAFSARQIELRNYAGDRNYFSLQSLDGPSRVPALAPLLSYAFQSLWLQSENYEALTLEKNHSDLLIDLISHDLGNHHQIMQLGIDLQRDLLEDLKKQEDGMFENGDLETIKISELKETTLQLAKHISELQAALRRSMDLVNNVKKLEKLYHDKNPDLSEIDLVESITRAAELVRASSHGNIRGATRPQIQISIHHAPSMDQKVSAKILGDELLGEIFTNLFSNSLKHSGRDLVEVSVRIEPYELGAVRYFLVNVSDNGQGIPEEMKARLFNRFSPKSRGSGLGLFIVQELVRRFGGKIWVEDSVLGSPSMGVSFGMMLKAA